MILELLGFIAAGIIFMAISIYIFHNYRELFIRDPQRVMTSDLFFAIFTKGAYAPVVVAFISFCMGILFLGVSLFIIVFVVSDILSPVKTVL